MWRALAAVALTQKQLKIAHKCHQVLGNKARTLYLEKTMKIAQDYAEKIGILFGIFIALGIFYNTLEQEEMEQTAQRLRLAYSC